MDVTSLVLVTLVAFGACKPSGFKPDAGTDIENPDGIPLEEIGKPCVYNPARPTETPTNDCFGGLTCAIVTRDITDALLNDEQPTSGFNTMGLILPLHEDHLTIHNDNGTDTGYCTLLGTVNAPPQCPVGTIAKGFSSSAAGGFMIACLKPCLASAECENGGVCDARYFDDSSDGSQAGTIGFCVKPCENDYPDCMRTGAVRYDPADETAFATQLAGVDLFGARTCNQDSGLCEVTGARSIGNDGDACDDTRDCANGALCLQTDASGVILDKGFCARRCFVDSNSAGLEGTCGTQLCQPALTFGYTELPVFDPGNLYDGAPIAAEGSSTRLLNGLCFDPCVEGFGCDADRPDVECGAVDAAEAGAAWNSRSMCLPPGIFLETE